MYSVIWTQPSGEVGELHFADKASAQDFKACLNPTAQAQILTN